MCRADIPSDYLDHPVLLENLSTLLENTHSDTEQYQWYYEGRNGWWKYDERSNTELEAAFNNGDVECTLLIAGALYSIDFQNMVQVRRSDPTRRRLVRRDHSMLQAKGVAGIKHFDSNKTAQPKSSSENNVNEIINQEAEDEIIEISDNEDVIPIYNTDSSQHEETDDIIQRFSTVNLREPESPTNISSTEDT
ncbi:E3 ubiquitin-protein ligase RNF146-A isoform X2 [Galleria mellonella]|nr:E3 ubiquitin-protein ligase RNF146-A isoform X2 [Galleria mellonella]